MENKEIQLLDSKKLKDFYEFIRERGRLYADKMKEKDMMYDINSFLFEYEKQKDKNNKLKEFEISMVCYNLENKYTEEEITDMLIEFAESKNIYLGGSVKQLQHKYPSYCCQKCGECIGWLGRFIGWVCCGLIKHECKN